MHGALLAARFFAETKRLLRPVAQQANIQPHAPLNGIRWKVVMLRVSRRAVAWPFFSSFALGAWRCARCAAALRGCVVTPPPTIILSIQRNTRSGIPKRRVKAAWLRGRVDFGTRARAWDARCETPVQLSNRTRPLEPTTSRSLGSANCNASTFWPAASSTKARSACSRGSANCSASPFCRTAASTV